MYWSLSGSYYIFGEKLLFFQLKICEFATHVCTVWPKDSNPAWVLKVADLHTGKF
jgi:hypothetical protein